MEILEQKMNKESDRERKTEKSGKKTTKNTQAY